MRQREREREEKYIYIYIYCGSEDTMSKRGIEAMAYCTFYNDPLQLRASTAHSILRELFSLNIFISAFVYWI